MISKVIYSRQSAFLEGRGLLDSVLLANKVLEEVKRKKKTCVIFKVDYEKDYDSVMWKFIYYMLTKLDLCEKWIGQVKACLESVSVSILVNGNSTMEFIPLKGMRQSDPLASFLFLIVAEGLADISRSAMEKDLVESVEIESKNIKVNMLQYADDTLFFCKATTKSVFNIKAILNCIELAFGLKVNILKSSISGVGMDAFRICCFAIILNSDVMKTPFKYLGMKVGSVIKRRCFGT